jgi:hypothetical protein
MHWNAPTILSAVVGLLAVIALIKPEMAIAVSIIIVFLIAALMWVSWVNDNQRK